MHVYHEEDEMKAIAINGMLLLNGELKASKYM